MRLLFLNRLYYPHVGGVEKHVRELGKRLVKRGYKVVVITTKHDRELVSREKSDGIEVIRFYQPKIRFLGLIYTWLWFLKNISLIKKSDLIHCHDVFIWYLPFRFLFLSKPVYTTFHGSWGQYPLPLKDLVQKRIGELLSRKVLSIGDYIPDNYGFKSDAISYGAADKPNKSLKKDNNLLIYVGRLDKNIALRKILKVIQELKEFRIEFCGDGELREECAKYGKVHGWVDPTSFMAKAKYCIASGYLTIIEALIHKCLVVTAYDHPLQKDYYLKTPFIKYIISSDNPRKIVKKINDYKNNEKATSKIIGRGYNWAENQTWDKLCKQYLQLWRLK